MTYFAGTNRPIDTGDTYFSELGASNISGRHNIVSKLNRKKLQQKDFVKEPPLKARIDHARWLVDCPNCNGAEFLFEDKIFWCTICNNSDIDGKLRKVKTPAKRKIIEDILSKRKIINRHWNVYESVEDLERENNNHSILLGGKEN